MLCLTNRYSFIRSKRGRVVNVLTIRDFPNEVETGMN